MLISTNNVSMETQGATINTVVNSDLSEVDNCKNYRYQREIDEILREESEFGLPQTMSPDEHLIANGSDITYSQFKGYIKDKYKQGKTSTLDVNTQELGTDVSQLMGASKQIEKQKELCAVLPKQHTPKSINYVKQILEATKSIKISSAELSTPEDQLYDSDSSDTKSDIEQNLDLINKDGDNILQNQQTKNVKHVKNSSPFVDNFDKSVISNSSKSYKKWNVKDNERTVEEKCVMSKSNINSVIFDISENVRFNQLDKTGCQNVRVAANVAVCNPEFSRNVPLPMPEKRKDSENISNFAHVITEGKMLSLPNKRRSLLSGNKLESYSPPHMIQKVVDSKIHNDNNISNKSSELSEICPKISGAMKIVKPSAKTLQVNTNCVASVSDHVPITVLGESEKSSSHQPVRDRSKSDSINNTFHRNSKILKATRKRMKYKILKNILKLLLKSPIKCTVTEFIARDQEIQALLKGWKLNMNLKKHNRDALTYKKIMSINLTSSKLCRNCKQVGVGSNLNNLKDCVNSCEVNDTNCTKSTQTECRVFLSPHVTNSWENHLKWINESCSESEIDFDLNSLY